MIKQSPPHTQADLPMQEGLASWLEYKCMNTIEPEFPGVFAIEP